MCVTIQRRLECHAVLVHPGHAFLALGDDVVRLHAGHVHRQRLLEADAQRHDLETAGIRQNRAVPGGKPVQAAHLPDQGGTGAQGQMVGIPQDDLCAQGFQILRMHGLHGTLRPHRHEDGGGNLSMRQIKRAQARGGGGIFLVKCKRHGNQAFCNLMKRAR